MGMVQEFKEFAIKGNAMDLAVGVIIGAAFSKIVDSIVSDLIRSSAWCLASSIFLICLWCWARCRPTPP